MTDTRAWAIRPKWHRFELPRSYALRQCEAAGVPFDFVERGLTSRTQPYIDRVWVNEAAAATIVEAAAGRPAGHYRRLRDLAQPNPELAYPERFLCRLCAAGERVEQIRHDRENWCLRHAGQMVWAGPGATPESQQVIVYAAAQARAERKFRRLVTSGRVDSRLHARVWEMVRDNASLSIVEDTGEASEQQRSSVETHVRAALYPQTVAVLELLSNRDVVERWRGLPAGCLREDITSTLHPADGPATVLVERIVLWMRPMRRRDVHTRIRTLDVPLDTVEPTNIIDTSAHYPTWVKRHPRAIAEWDWVRNVSDREPWINAGASKPAWWLCNQGHSWSISPTVRGMTGSNCPYCAGQDVWPGHTDLGTLHPDLASEWDTTPGVNKGDPDHVSAISARRINWICGDGHRWVAPIKDRTRGQLGCPYCAGRRTVSGKDDLATLHPGIAAEWHPDLNGHQTARDCCTNR